MATKSDMHSLANIQTLDRQIENLMNCRPIPEDEVRKLCELVSIAYFYIDFQLSDENHFASIETF